ncbi:alpha/beta-hydrolase [Phellopilus nigrolimitatus]|nr:alpha/beta-hydrolase [Phellopilus nigrolimitatus]
MAFGIPKSVEVKYEPAVVQNMLTLLKAAPFPDKAPIDTTTPLKTHLETEWDYIALEKKIARFDNYLVHYEHGGDSLDLHYVHVKSPRSDAIPIILLHGWPGTFFDFHKVVEPLVNPPNSNLPAFHVVIPSLPGYFLSTLPRRDGWSIADTARVFNGLMTSVLGYATYAGQGGDWGSMILRVMGSLFPESLTAMHFNMFIAPSVPGIDPSSYSETDRRSKARLNEFRRNGMGYSAIQNTKPFTIGLAIASSPLAVLTYIGEKIYSWSDPGLVDQQDILDTVALYFLSGSFATSVNKKELPDLMISGKWPLKNRFGYSVFPFELGGPPKVDIAAIGPLVYYKEHSKGGHFPALDCPKEYVEDLQEFLGKLWSRL